MLGCIQPMSSAMMNMMFGFDVCAIALDAGSADAVANAASAAPADMRLRVKLIAISLEAAFGGIVRPKLESLRDAPTQGSAYAQVSARTRAHNPRERSRADRS